MLEAFLRLSNEAAYPEQAIEYALDMYSQDIDLARAWLADPEHTDLVAALGRGEDITMSSASPTMAQAVSGSLTLLNLMYMTKSVLGSDEDSVLFRLARILSRIEELSHVLVWSSSATPARAATDAATACVSASTSSAESVAAGLMDAVVSLSGSDVTLSLVELPRLGARFQPRVDSHGTIKLFALDQAGWWISDAAADPDAPGARSLANLLIGIPHCVVLENASGELRVMVPNCDIQRPLFAPFSTELVLNRASASWLSRSPTRYYLYSVHTTQTFLQAPSVAATFYLILLRFAARDYEAVFRLSETCQVDVPFTPEEDRVFALLAELNGDLTPDAVACRLKLSLCVLLGDNQVPWSVTDQYDKYLSRLSHVSAGCRLEREEEEELIPFILAEEADALLVPNRISLFSAAEDGAESVTLSSRVLKRGGDVWRLALERQPVLYSSNHTTMSTAYYQMARDPVMSDAAVLTFMEALEQEEESGSTGKVGFLGLYDLLHPDSPVSANLLGVNITRSLGELQTRLFQARNSRWGGNEGVKGNAVSSVSFHAAQLATMIQFPWVSWPHVPRMDPLPRMLVRGVEVSCTDQEMPQMTQAAEMLRNFFNELFITLQSLVTAPYYLEARDRIREGVEVEDVLSAPREVAVDIAAATASSASGEFGFPRVSNHACSSRSLAPFTNLGGLSLSPEDLQAFESAPLSVLDLDAYVSYEGSSETPAASLPFDLGPHPASKSHVANLIMERLDDDVQTFKAQVDNSRIACVVGLTSDVLESLFAAASADTSRDDVAAAVATLARASSALNLLKSDLESVLGDDVAYISAALDVVLETATRIPKGSSNGEEEFELLRMHGARTALIFDHITCTLLSSAAEGDLKEVNPFLGDDDVATILALTQAILLRATRVAHTRRVIAAVSQVYGSLSSLSNNLSGSATKGSSLVDEAFRSKLAYQVTHLGEALVCERHYGALDPQSGALVYDPRFLVFEYIFDILLRARQVEMVNDFVSAAAKDGSGAMVQQMIMGAGKTTVIGPLLALILADGNQLVMQVVPTPLLEMSRNVMRSRFTAIVPKRVYTFTYDRSEPDNASLVNDLWKKLDAARRRRAVVCTTPDAVKSLMLKYVEQLHSLEMPQYLLNSGRAASSELSTVDLLEMREVLDEENGGASSSSSSDDSVLESIADGSAYSKLTEEIGGAMRNQRKSQQLLAKLHLRSDASDALVKIMDLWGEGVLMMDEVDVLLHPLKSELNYPIGEKYPIDMEGARWDLPIHLLDLVFSHKRGELFESISPETAEAVGISVDGLKGAFAAALDEGYATHMLQRSPHLALMDVEFYHEKLKPLLGSWALAWVWERSLGSLGSVSGDVLVQYMVGDRGDPSLADQVQGRVLGSILPVDMKLLNLANDWLTSFLPHVLSKVDRVSYGILSATDLARCDPRMPRSRRLTAVPFVGKDVPSRSSEFAQPDVVIGLTILAYRYEGVRKTDLRRVVEQLKKDFGQEIGPPDERPSSVLFTSWLSAAKARERAAEMMGVPLTPVSPTGSRAAFSFDEKDVGASAKPDADTGVFPLPLFQPNDPQQLDRLYRIIKRHPPFIHYYLRRQVFPPCMNFRKVKISASGQELGSQILFGTRLGFSGTPSNLMPADLGRCLYEAGSDGKILHVLTSRDVVSVGVKETEWTAKSLLRDIASASPPAHALIDTGALITGMDNEAVARYLLGYLPEWMEGVVYLDSSDRQMILLRSGGPGVPLAQCGVSLDKRFTFYDQVHTTGMDIKQTPNAKAMLTIGKDMSFRDYAQGAFRMRGIGKGQTIELVVTPEVANKIEEDLKPLAGEDSLLNGGRPELDVSAWLLINSMRGESLQFIQLCLQELHTVWRKHALAALRADSAANAVRGREERMTRFLGEDEDDSPTTTTTSGPTRGKAYLRTAIDKFREDVVFGVEDGVPVLETFEEVLEGLVGANAGLTEEGDVEVIAGIRDRAAQVSSATMAELQAGRSTLDAEVVNENEQEAEQEQQKEKDVEKQKEREIEYSRDDEAQNPWAVSILSRGPGEHGEGEAAFYPLSSFRVHADSETLPFPSSLLLSDNHFRPSWVGLGERRLKNVTVILEWVPRVDEPGERYLVVVSLAEGATLHRLVHWLLSTGGSVGSAGLQLVTLDGQVLSRTTNMRGDDGVVGSCLSRGEMGEVMHRVGMLCLRFVNNAMFYSEAELAELAEGLVRADEPARLAFFDTVLRYRRRERMFWADTPVAKIFTRREEWGMLKARALVYEAVTAMQRKRMFLRVAFRKFDADGDGLITQDELMRAFSYLKLGFSTADAIQLFHILELGEHISVSFEEFCSKFANLTVAEVLEAEEASIARYEAAKARAADPSKTLWRCGGCEAMTAGDRDQCGNCGRSRFMDGGLMASSWVCSWCTMSNSLKNSFCVVCDYGRVILSEP